MKGRRYRVNIQSRTATLDSPPGWRDRRNAGTWITVDTVWAYIAPERGHERNVASRRQAEIDYTVEIRYQAAPYITEKHRLTYTEDANSSPEVTRTLNVLGCLPDRKRRRIVLECVEGADRG